jgi:hypothetical protein
MKRLQHVNALRAMTLAAALFFSVAALGGCGHSAATTVVNGKVTYKNAAVTGGTITFHPARGAPTSGPINPDGTFSFGGIPVGPQTVTVETESVHYKGHVTTDYTQVVKPPEGARVESGPRPVYVPIPLRYGDPKTSGLTRDLDGGKNELEFDLTN